MSPPTAPDRRARPLRADARRNYERLLTAAEAVFRERGTGASLEEVARRAGTAIGTLYGHFPTRQALLEALLRDRQQAVFDLGDRLLAQPGGTPEEARAALVEWITAVTGHAATYSGLAGALLGSLDDETSELHAACARMSAAGEALVREARAAGAVRPDVTASDVFALINSAAWLRGQVPRDQADRLLTVMLDGLRPR
ncbi:TetR/AcrR family transcriptional regulator [Streptomyces specialis]|uniref:TetR/AcrR family transcriptional regulator n=1 Tax=Streptomyces specialis TaxID=498367 RepID=UPI00073F15CE|nr:TetR/AcrR family transcriptional regulator [Streptomyces specialis]